MTTPGKRNLITDVEGLSVGNAHDSSLKSGTTAVIFDQSATAAVHVMGGAPGTRETDLLAPQNSVEKIDGIFLSGGSAFGLDAGTGVQAWLREQGKGLELAGQCIPLVPGAILFDLINGGDKDWGRYPPYRDLGYQAASAAADDFELGTAGAGYGATAGGVKGGLGSASTVLPGGITVAALVAVNPTGSPLVGDSRHFWAAPFEIGDEFGGLGFPPKMPDHADAVRLKYRDMRPGANTTLAVVATDTQLTRDEALRMAMCAHDGFARAIWPVHTPQDGDIVFAAATGTKPRPDSFDKFTDLFAIASATVSRAIARAIYEATPEPNDLFPTWKQRFG